MRAILAPVGSRGDVQPMLALALALREHGHEAVLCAGPNFEGWVRGHGVEFAVCGRDLRAILRERAAEIAHPVRGILILRDLFRSELDEQVRVLTRLSTDADVLVGAGAQLAGASVAEHCGIAYRYVAYTPQAVPGSAYGSPLVPLQNLPAPLRRLTHRGAALGFRLALGGAVNVQRRRLGLAPQRDVNETFRSPVMLVATDPELGPLPADAEIPAVQVGHLAHRSDGELPTALATFLDAGAAPFYVGFGSAADPDPGATLALIDAVASRLRRRAIFCSGWSAADGLRSTPRCLVIEDAPHDALFPRVAAVVHAGGSGTTAAAARSGRPQVVVPHALDQFFWGKRVFASGLGPGPIARRRLSVRRLAAALDTALSDHAILAHAERVGARLREVDAASAAVRVLEDAARPDRGM